MPARSLMQQTQFQHTASAGLQEAALSELRTPSHLLIKKCSSQYMLRISTRHQYTKPPEQLTRGRLLSKKNVILSTNLLELSKCTRSCFKYHNNPSSEVILSSTHTSKPLEISTIYCTLRPQHMPALLFEAHHCGFPGYFRSTS